MIFGIVGGEYYPPMKKCGYWEWKMLPGGYAVPTTIDPIVEVKPDTIAKMWYLSMLASTSHLVPKAA